MKPATRPEHEAVLLPPLLRMGDKIRFVSPASTPETEAVLRRVRMLEGWGLTVDIGPHAFRRMAYLAGTDDERLADFNDALRDPTVRAIFTTRGGKGSYRIADRLDFAAARNDPKFVVGFSDITILHLSLWRHCRLVGIHGALMDSGDSGISEQGSAALRRLLMTGETTTLRARPEEPTSVLTTDGEARGRLIGGNLSMISTAAGWALPNLTGAILLLEAVNMYIGQVDRQLTMLRKGGHLSGLAGVAVGQFTGFEPHSDLSIIDLLRDHLGQLGVPILGGLPLGHGDHPLSVPVGTMAVLDAASGQLTVAGTEAGLR